MNFNNIPEEMRAMPNWSCYKTYTDKEGKRKKIIISPKDGKFAKSKLPETWADFDTAYLCVGGRNNLYRHRPRRGQDNGQNFIARRGEIDEIVSRYFYGTFGERNGYPYSRQRFFARKYLKTQRRQRFGNV